MAKFERKDRLYHQAKSEGFRGRAAYKLIELDKHYKMLKPNAVVVDLGCFPGGWLQVAASKIKKGKVIGIDRKPIPPFIPGELPDHVKVGENLFLLEGDFTDPAVREQLVTLCGGKVDVILSDMSPELSGIRFRDVVRIVELIELAFNFAHEVLKPGGMVVAKTFPGQEVEELYMKVRSSFTKFTREYLDSTRKSSSEFYLVGTGFRP